jgi:hypothetical protein
MVIGKRNYTKDLKGQIYDDFQVSDMWQGVE